MLVPLSAFHKREQCGEVRNDEGLSHHCVCAQLKKETTFAHLRAR